jgi:chemotaxis protein CheD
MSNVSRPREALDSTVIVVQQGDYAVSLAADVVFSTVLGSCIAACVRDVVAGVGGMNHFLLPGQQAPQTPTPAYGESARYGAYAMERLINAVLVQGTGKKANLEFKIFGGGRINAALSDIGGQNITFVHDFLRTEGYAIAGEDVGGTWSRRVMFWPKAGRAMIKRLESEDSAVIARSEIAIARRPESRPNARADIELF